MSLLLTSRYTKQLLATSLAVAIGCALLVRAQGIVQVGYVVATADPGSSLPVGTVLFSYSNSQGVLVSQVGVGSTEPLLSSRIFVDEAGTATGLALVNDSGRSATCVLTLRDAQGNEVSHQSLILSNGQHLSRYVRELFSGVPAGFVGSLTIASDNPLAAVTLRESVNSRGEPLYATLPVIDLADASAGVVVFPHIAAGEGYTTQLILVNRSSQRIRGVVQLADDDGRPLPLQIGDSTVSNFAYQIEANGTYRAELASSSSLSVGYATVFPENGGAAPSGTAIFQFKIAGQLVTETGVAATAQTTLARIFVDQAGSRTGLAIANPGTAVANLALTLMDRYGSLLANTTLTVPPGGHKAAFVDELFTGVSEGFTGLVELNSSSPVAPITLDLTTNARGETILTTLPVADLTRIPTASSLVFPQVALYGGFSTRLIFIHPDRANSSSGRLQFYLEDGTPMILPMGGQQSSQFNYRFSPGSARQFRPGNSATVAKITLLDASNAPTTELTINEGDQARPRLSVVDSTGAVRDDFDVAYTSSNSDVAPLLEGVITGKVAGFSTLTISAGNVVNVAVVTVTGIGTGVPGFAATGVAQDPAQRLYLASTDQQTVLLAESVTQTPAVYAGMKGIHGLKNDVRLNSQFNNPAFLAVNHYEGSLYVSDAANNVIRRVRPGPDGRVDTLAGTGSPGSGDGQNAQATFRNPQGIAIDDRGQLWVADSDNHSIRRINLSAGRVDTIAGQAGNPGMSDGQGNTARFRSPSGIAVEPEPVSLQLDRERRGLPPPPVRVIVADTGNNALRRVYEDGRVETIGVGAAPMAAMLFKRSPATTAPALNAPEDVAADSFGTIYFTEPIAKQVRAILPTGNIVAAAGPSTFSKPQGVVVSETGRIVVSDMQPREIRYGEPQITSITPNRVSSRGGAKVKISGKNFAPGTLIVAGDVVITNITTAESNTETISFVTPPLPSGLTTLTVQNRGGLAQAALLVDAVPLSELPIGYITTVAGGSTFVGDGGVATSAPLTPSSVVLDPNGNLLIADSIGHRIRRVDARSGIVTSIAGNGLYGFSGDGGPAIAAALNTPLGIALDGAGNLFIADSYNDRIRRVDVRTGVITTVAGAGNGFAGDDGPATAAYLNLPTGIAIDAAGNLFFSDTLNHRVRRIDSAGVITTVAGDGEARFAGDNGPGPKASINRPEGLFFDGSGNLLITDSYNGRIRKLDRNAIITTVVGSGENGFSSDGTPALASALATPLAVAVDTTGNLFIVDYENCRIRKVAASDSRIATVAGTGDCYFYGDGGQASAAAINQPRAIAVDAGGNVFIADSENRRVRRVDGKTGIISTVAGTGEGAFLGENGPATQAVINYPLTITFDNAGNLIIGDSDNRVRKVDMNSGIITIIAGGGGPPDGIGDGGLATEADVWAPSGLAFDRDANLYIADQGHARVRKVDARTKIITTIAGTGEESFSGDGGPATRATLKSPRTLAINASSLFISDEGNSRIRQLDLQTGTITTYAGNGTKGLSGDGGPANLASISSVWSFVMDPAGNIYVADYDNARIRRIDGATRVISSIAGGGTLYPDNNVSTRDAAILPISLAFDGRLFMMELFRQGILRIGTDSLLALVAGNGNSNFSGDNGPAVAASLSYPAAMAFDRSGNLFIADSNNNRIRAVRGPIP